MMRCAQVGFAVGTLLVLGVLEYGMAGGWPEETIAPTQTQNASVANLPAIDTVIQGFVDKREIAGAVAVVVDAEKILHLGAVGSATLPAKAADSSVPMQPDAIFWIASMSKPITGACVMQLVDQGKVSLDDPIDRHLPEMRELKNDAGEKVTVTVRQLLNHTSGMRELKEPYIYRSLAEASLLYAKAGVEFPAGSKWQYSQTGINTAARIVEVVSGLTFDEYARKNLFEPLGMRDTAFYLTPEQAARLATSYSRAEDGTLSPAPIFLLAGKSPTDRNRMPAANGGLFSTATDYARFCQMLLGKGVLQGRRVLSEKAVVQLQTPSTGELVCGFTPGNAWGVGVCVVQKPQGVTSMLAPGTFGHGGAYGTQAWVDPVNGRAYVLMVQRANFPNADDSEVRRAFQEAAVKIGR
jgi:CubicO group peptidase (beta-lactamase class C family)